MIGNNRGGAKTDTVVKLVFIFFISLLSFSVGTFVGKQVSDSDYRRAALENDFKSVRSTASIDPEHTETEPEQALSEEDIASLTDEFVNAEKEEAEKPQKETHQEMTKVAKNDTNEAGGYKKITKNDNEEMMHKDETVEKEMPKKEAEETQRKVASAADRIAKDMAPTKDLPKKRKPDSVLPSTASSSIGKYTIQVGSYATEEEAKGHAEKLKTKGYSAFYIPAAVKGKTWYRVSVGLFPSQKSAMSFKRELKEEAGIKSSFIQKITK